MRTHTHTHAVRPFILSYTASLFPPMHWNSHRNTSLCSHMHASPYAHTLTVSIYAHITSPSIHTHLYSSYPHSDPVFDTECIPTHTQLAAARGCFSQGSRVAQPSCLPEPRSEGTPGPEEIEKEGALPGGWAQLGCHSWNPPHSSLPAAHLATAGSRCVLPMQVLESEKQAHGIACQDAGSSGGGRA